MYMASAELAFTYETYLSPSEIRFKADVQDSASGFVVEWILSLFVIFQW